MDRFLAECERVKVALSTTEEELLEVPRLAMIGGRARGIRTTLTRGDLEALIDADIQHALVEVDRVLATARMSEREVGTALMIGGTSNIPLLRREMQRRFGTRAFTAEDAQTIIAEGAAAIAHNRHRPFLARPVQLLLVDGTPYEVFGKDTVVPLDTQRELTLFCTDPRDGEARLVVAEQTVEGDRGSIRQQTIVRVPVTRRIPPPGNNERLYASFGIDENLILRIEAYSASIQQIASEEIHDLAFGLRLT
jgi:molecular chaperone DnaK (HSP70)